MNSWKNVSLLEMVEAYAEQEGLLIDSEEALSEKFDNEIAPMVVEQYGEDDTDAMNQAFNDWSDGLCKDDEIHPEQYNRYGYVGKYSDDQ